MTGEGCPIPQLDDTGERIMELRGLLESLQPLVDPGIVCRMFDADLDDFKLLAVVEAELKQLLPKGTDHGEGH